MQKGYYVGDEFRKNDLSLTPGGSRVEVIYKTETKIYDKIKSPSAYVSVILKRDKNILEIRVDGVPYWKMH